MDYFQGVVLDYLRADRAVFVNSECCIQINAGKNPDKTGPHWYCDAIAIDLRASHVYLCEISYAKSLDSLLKRLEAWASQWDRVCAAVARDCWIQKDWPVQPWVFIPEKSINAFSSKLAKKAELNSASQMPEPKFTSLESVAPWNYASWNRHDNMSEQPMHVGD